MSSCTQIETNLFTSRRSTKRFQGGRLIPSEIMNEVFRLAFQAPSSWNLQHWRCVLVQDAARKRQIYEIACQQQQIVDCSAVVVVLGDIEANLEAESILDETVAQGLMPRHAKDAWLNAIQQRYEKNSEFGRHEAILNGSLAAMQILLAAEHMGLSSGPIGSFDAAKLKTVLRVPERFIPLMLITLGYSAEEPYPTMRLPVESRVVLETF